MSLADPRAVPPSGSPAAAVQRLAVIADTAREAFDLLRPVLGAAIARRHGVRAFVRTADAASLAALEALGVSIQLAERAGGLARLGLGAGGAGLGATLTDWSPHVVLAMGDSLVEGARAARAARVPRIIGLVSEPPEPLARARGIGGLVALRRARGALSACTRIVCFNADDARTLTDAGVGLSGRHGGGSGSGHAALTVLPGPGVVVAEIPVLPLPPLGDGLVFLTIAPATRGAGIADLMAAARLVRQRAPTARFVLAGAAAEGAERVDLVPFVEDGTATVAGPSVDVTELLAAAHVYVDPTHGDGLPNRLLEAMASGRPVVTTATRGFRETVDERVNGCLVPPGDPEALAAALQSFLKRPDLIPSMARASRLKAERRFDERLSTAALLDVLGLA